MAQKDMETILGVLNKYLGNYIATHDLSYVASEISKDPTTKKIDEMGAYLMKPDKEFTMYQVMNIKPIINNQVLLCMNEITSLVTTE